MVTSATDYPALWSYLTDQFALGGKSIHGPWHWRRVEKNGLNLAAASGADIEIVKLFAVFHDSCRQTEFDDHGHGLRGGELAQLLRGQHYHLSDARFALLYFACAWHERGRISDDPTIGSCWDADRLDLPRVGIQPTPELMSTPLGKQLATG